MISSRAVWVASALFATATAAAASASADWADVMCSYERGLYANAGYTNPQAVFTAAGSTDDQDGLVSLGQWTDDPDEGNNADPVGIILGFSTSINNGAGDDLIIKGNALNGWWEPGYVEVARETTSPGATTDGWKDETWYLLKPGNYDQVGDPRDGPLTINFSMEELEAGQNPYTDPEWSSNEMTGYADVKTSGDLMDIDWAIDGDGNPVSLSDIAYVHIRTVTDSGAGLFGAFTTEIDFVEALNGYVPATPGDADLDGDVDDIDLAMLLGSWGQSGQGWSDGDFTGESDVNDIDLALLLNNWGAGSALAAVPEPATMTLMLLGGVALLRKRVVR